MRAPGILPRVVFRRERLSRSVQRAARNSRRRLSQRRRIEHAEVRADQAPLGIVEQRRRQSPRAHGRPERRLRVDQHLVQRQAEGGQVGLHGGSRFALVDEEKTDVAVSPLCGAEGRHLLAARTAPARPQVHDDGPAGRGRAQVHGRALVQPGDRQCRHRCGVARGRHPCGSRPEGAACERGSGQRATKRRRTPGAPRQPGQAGAGSGPSLPAAVANVQGRQGRGEVQVRIQSQVRQPRCQQAECCRGEHRPARSGGGFGRVHAPTHPCCHPPRRDRRSAPDRQQQQQGLHRKRDRAQGEGQHAASLHDGRAGASRQS